MITDEIYDQFNHILSQLKEKNDLPIETSVQIAQVILQESGKDRRVDLLREAKSNNNEANSNYNNNVPATLKQKNALLKFGVKFSNDITKSEASKLLDGVFK